MAFAERYEQYRLVDLERDGLVRELLREHDKLKGSYQVLLDELHKEQEDRRAWQARCSQSELDVKASFEAYDDATKAADAHGFVVVILDGDGAIFRDELLKKGSEGGSNAATLLDRAVKAHLKKTYPGYPTATWPIFTFIFLNVKGLGGALHESGVLSDAGGLTTFIHAFEGANPLYNFIDVGPGKEKADHKARETLRAYLSMPACKHTFFGPCHDLGYVPFLSQYSATEMSSRLTLIETWPTAPAFLELGLEMTSFDPLFRKENLPGRGKTPFGAKAQLRPQNGHESKSTAQRSHEVTSAWTTVPTKTNKVVQKDRKYILLSANHERLDPELPVPGHAVLASFERKRQAGGGINFCNPFHLFGKCSITKCHHQHGEPLTAMEQVILRDKARGLPCENGSSCRNPLCFKGHQCKFGDKCGDKSCRMGMFHHLDTRPYKKIYDDGTEVFV